MKKSVKKFLPLLLVFTLLTVSLAGCGKADEKSGKKIVLTEVAHSIFYAPMYVAFEKGYFAEEGLNVELVNGFGADKVMTAVLSGDTDIGFMGSEASI